MYKFLTEAASFKEYKENYGKQFVGLFISEQSSKDLRSWCLRSGFDLTSKFDGTHIDPNDFDFHTTVFFTSNEVYLKSGEFEIDKLPVLPLSFEVYGKEKNIPVLELNPDASHLRDFRNMFESQGLKDQWPSWKPHISLSYKYDGTPDLEFLDIPTFPIFADKVVIKKSS